MIDFRYYSLDQAQDAQGTAVVIDVLRAFTTAAFAFDVGAKVINPVSGIDEAIHLGKEISDSLIMGEDHGCKPEGFDFGNSPLAISRENLSGKTVIQRTSAGTQGIVRAVNASQIIAASFVVAKASAEYLRLLQPDIVSFIITGSSFGRDGDEDKACAEYIEALVTGRDPEPSHFISRVGSSTVGRIFLDRSHECFHPHDLSLSIQVDRFPFFLQVSRENTRISMRRIYSGNIKENLDE